MNELLRCPVRYYEELKSMNAALKNQMDVACSEYEELFKRANDLEQKSLLNYVDIHGIPEFDKNSVPIVEKIASVLGVELTVVQAFKIFTKSKGKPIKVVAELMTLGQKEALMLFAKMNNLKANQLNANWGDRCVFINEALTGYNSKLMFQTKTFAKERGFKYVWFRNCNIYLKKADNARVYVIRHEKDLHAIV